jgi:hypothetical protein
MLLLCYLAEVFAEKVFNALLVVAFKGFNPVAHYFNRF